MKKYPFLKTIRKSIYEVWKKEKNLFGYFLIYTLVATITPILAVYLPRLIIENLSQISLDLNKIIIQVTLISITIAICSFLERYIIDNITIKIMGVRIGLLTSIFDKTNRLDYHYTEDPDFRNENSDAYDIIGNNDFEILVRKIFVFGSQIILIVIYIYFLLKLHYLVVLGILLTLAFSILSAFIVKKYRFKKKKSIASSRRRIRYYEQTMQDFSYGKDIRLYNFQESIKESYDYEIKSFLTIFKKIKNKEFSLALIDTLFVLISDGLLYYFLITRVFNGLEIAMFSFYLLISISLTTLLKEIVNNLIFVVEKGQYLNDYFRFMETDFNEQTKGIKDIQTDTLEIEFKDLSFKYPKTDKWIIKDLNLKIKPGEKLAIVGLNGAGKTTLVKLLLRLFKPTEGAILINGVNALDYDKEYYQSLFSPVFQDINILAFSIRENITLGLSNDETRIWEVLKTIGLEEKVKKLENGLDTNLLKNIDEKGILLSGGENQKLAIARALYKDGRVVVLDEPTASLDALAEAEVYENFSNLIENKTAIFISHRLASTKFCDKIALFNKTKLEEYGSHDQLMDLQGEYYKMFVIQGKYYQEGEIDESI